MAYPNHPIIGLVCLLLLLISLFACSCQAQQQQQQDQTKPTTNKPKNFIMMIADGFSPTSETFARVTSGRSRLPLDNYIKGSVITFSADSFVTDSAAAATAYSCGIKTYNLAVGVVGPEDTPHACGTTFEAAKAAGFRTGLVVTSRITHATPASFSSHVSWRDNEFEISEQQALYQNVDLLFGGGKNMFVKRPDGINLLQFMEQRGYQIVNDLAEFNGPIRLPAIGLFAPSHMDYEIDRRQQHPPTQPSLVEMTKRALHLLSEPSALRNPLPINGQKPASAATDDQSNAADPGFFLMIEGSKVDLAAHDHDAPAHYHEIMQFHAAFEAVLEFIDKHPDTMLIVTADHGTGGISIGRGYFNFTYPEYVYYPDVVLAVTKSAKQMTDLILKGADISQTILQYTGLTPNAKQIAAIEETIRNGDERFVIVAVSEVVSYAAMVGWTTIGHVGVDVPLYTAGAGVDTLTGVIDNTDIAKHVMQSFKLDVSAITRQLSNMTFTPPPQKAQFKACEFFEHN